MVESDSTSVVLELSANADAPAVARRFVEQHASGLDDRTKQDVRLLVSEIVTNAVIHGKPSIELRVSTEPAGIGVAVHDDGEIVPMVPTAPGSDATGGRGLYIVDALASDWGVTPAEPPPGKTVWFRLVPDDD